MVQKIHGILTILSIVAIISSIFTIIPSFYQTTAILNGQQTSGLTSLSIAPARYLDCDYMESIHAYYTDGTTTAIGSQFVYFNPQITYDLINLSNQKVIDHFDVMPSIKCNVDAGFTPYVSGTVEVQTMVTGNDGITRIVTDELLPVPTQYFATNQIVYLTTSTSVTTAQQVLTTLGPSPSTVQPIMKFYVKWNLQFGDKTPGIPVTTAQTYLTNTWTAGIMSQQQQPTSTFEGSMYTQTTISCPYPYVKSVNGNSCVPSSLQSVPFASGGCPSGTYNAYTLTTGNTPYEICLPSQPSPTATSYTSTTLNHPVLTTLPTCPSGQWLVNLVCQPISTTSSPTTTSFGTGQLEFFYTLQFSGDPASYCGTGQNAAAGGCLVNPTNGILNIPLKPASIIGSPTATQSSLASLNVEAVMNPSQKGLNLDSSAVTYTGNILINEQTISIPANAILTDGSNGFVDSSGLFRFPTASINPSTIDTIIKQAGVNAPQPVTIKITIYATGTFSGHNQNGKFTGVVGTTTSAPYVVFNAYYLSQTQITNIVKTNNTQQTPTCVSLFGQQACFPTPPPNTQTPPPQPPNPCGGFAAGSICIDNASNPGGGNSIFTPPNSSGSGSPNPVPSGGSSGGIVIPTPDPPSSGGSSGGFFCQGNDTSSCNTLLPPLSSTGNSSLLWIGIIIITIVIILMIIAVVSYRRGS